VSKKYALGNTEGHIYSGVYFRICT